MADHCFGLVWVFVFFFLRWVIKEENGKLVPLFLFGLRGDGSGGADVCIKPHFLFAEAPVEFAGGLSRGGSWSKARAHRGALGQVPSLSRGRRANSRLSVRPWGDRRGGRREPGVVPAQP